MKASNPRKNAADRLAAAVDRLKRGLQITHREALEYLELQPGLSWGEVERKVLALIFGVDDLSDVDFIARHDMIRLAQRCLRIQ